MRGAFRLMRPLGYALTAAQIGLLARDHWRALPAADRRRMRELVARSKGRPSNLDRDEQRELRELVRSADVPRLARTAARTVAAGPAKGARSMLHAANRGRG